MTPGTQARIESALGSRVAKSRLVAGGDINEAVQIFLSDGRRAFVKTNLTAPRGMFPAEARGLAWLKESSSLKVPEVYAVCRQDATGQAAYLVLEWIDPGKASASFDEELGRGLAQLHRATAPEFGFDSNNFIGSLPQDNRSEPSWPAFLWSRRLLPQVKRAVSAGRLDASSERGFEKLAVKLPQLFSVAEPPARLHGDLWSGNLYTNSSGNPCLIDPAVYAGHREMDLGMMRLFGGFSARVFAAYAECYPLLPGFEERLALLQLYPLLVHVNLFGGGYAGSVKKAVARYV